MADEKFRRDSRQHRRKHGQCKAGKQRRRDKRRDQQIQSYNTRQETQRVLSTRPVCPYCGRNSHRVENTQKIFGKDIGPVWVCNGYPKCDSYVMCHVTQRRYGEALGTLANKDLRRARMMVHRVLDLLWSYNRMTRNQVYAEMAEAMGIDSDDCHVAMFDLGQCEEAAAFARLRLKEIYGTAKPREIKRRV